MKKTLVALAALASISAFAQSTVTISGRLFAGYNSFKNSAGTTTNSIGNGPAASLMTIKGTEDMGGGNSASFYLEMQPSFSNGSTAGVLFNRGAWLGLGGGWGDFKLGRTGTVAMPVICTVDQGSCLTGFNGGGILFGGTNSTSRWISGNVGRGQNGNAGMAASAGGGTAQPDVTRVIDAFTYSSPNFSGVSAQLQYALGNLPSNTANGTGNTLGLNVTYGQGPLFVGLALQKANADAAFNVTGSMTTLGATYDFGVAKVGAAYQSESASGAAALWTSAKGMALTVTAPFGAATPYIRLGNHKTNGTGAFGVNNGADSAIVNVGANYSLSKRTLINLDFATDGKGNSGVGTNTSKPTLLYVGVQHYF